MVKIYFLESEISVEVPIGCELLKAKELYPEIPIKFGCTHGECGVCAVKPIGSGSNLSKCSRLEQLTLRKIRKPSGYRLACQCAVEGDSTFE